MSAADRPLQQLRDWRRTLEREALARFANAQSRLLEQEQRESDLRGWYGGYVASEVARAAGSTCMARDLRGARAFLRSLDDALAQQGEVVSRLRRDLEACRDQWRKASAELEVAEALLERRRHERRRHSLVVERRQLDDIAAAAQRRRQRSEPTVALAGGPFGGDS